MCEDCMAIHIQCRRISLAHWPNVEITEYEGEMVTRCGLLRYSRQDATLCRQAQYMVHGIRQKCWRVSATSSDLDFLTEMRGHFFRPGGRSIVATEIRTDNHQDPGLPVGFKDEVGNRRNPYLSLAFYVHRVDVKRAVTLR